MSEKIGGSTGGLASRIFVGRLQEIGVLTTALEDALSGQGRLVMLAGEPGIGKTRIAQELAAYAAQRDAKVLWGRCHEDRGAPPYWPWVQAIRSYSRELNADQLLSEMGSGASEIAEIVPGVKERLPDVPPSPPLETADQARFRLFDSVTTFFRNASQNQPWVIILDNLHWADKPSLLLIEFMAREMAEAGLLVLGTYRHTEISAGHDLSSTLGEVAREPLFQQIRLEGLSEQDVGRFLQGAAQIEPSPQLISVVYEKTEGNPFFITEVVRLLIQEGAFSSGSSGSERAAVGDGTTVGIPDSVRLAIGRRISHLSQECHWALTVASVIGREFGLEQLERLIDEKGNEQVLEALEEAVSAAMIEEIPDVVGRYQFRHILIQQTLADELSTVRRSELHARIGEALEDIYRVDAEDRSDELAYHFLRGNIFDKAAEYTLNAGDRASTIYAWEQAIAQYETAVDLLEKLEAEPRRQAEVLEKLAHAAGMSKGKGFLAPLEKALGIYQMIGDRLKAGAILYQLTRLFSSGAGDWEVSHSHALKAVEVLVPYGESALLAGAYVQAGHTAAHLSMPVSGAIALMEKGLAMAERLGSVGEINIATNHIAHALVYHAGEIGRGLELHHKSWQMAKESDNPVTSAMVAFMLSTVYISLRDVNSTILWSKKGVEAAGLTGLMHRRLLCYLTLSQASILRGDVSCALQGLEAAQEAAKKIDADVSKLPAPRIIAQALVCFYLGDWNKAREELLTCLASGKETHTVAVMQTASCALGELYLEEDDLESAETYLLEAATVSEAKGEKTLEIAPRALLAQVASAEGELDEARTHLRRAQEILSNGEDWRGLAAEVHQSEAVLAAAEERWQEAEVAFQKAIEINRRYHLPYYEARSLKGWGQMRLSRNEPGDKQQGTALLDQALDIFQRIQAAKMVEKVAALKEKAERGPTNVLEYPDGLTQREVDVLRLIAAGNSNREIAQELFLSVRTIERHITNIYSKTNARGRADATAYAICHDLSILPLNKAGDRFVD